ncbi:MAG: hypothetical protein JTT11_07895 [Candidatus Brockarchaeota archaeon]|nr:hypothetical protein [Candidatus Brockarchaeota archaeon]
MFQEPELEEIEAIFEEPLEFAKGGEEGEVITKQELLDYLRTMEGLAHLLKGSQKYGELLKEAVIDATDSVFASAYGRERLDSDEEAVRYAIKAIERACQRRGIPLPPEWHE